MTPLYDPVRVADVADHRRGQYQFVDGRRASDPADVPGNRRDTGDKGLYRHSPAPKYS
jgi:hypothetical protein